MDRDGARLRGRLPAAATAVPTAVAAAVPLAFLGAFFVWPVAAIVARGLSLEALADAAASGRLRQVAWFTLWQALVSTAVTVTLGVPGAVALGRFRFPGRALVRAAVTVPFVLPTVVVATAFVALLGPAGPLPGFELLPSVTAIVAAHAFFNYAVVVRTVGNLLAHLDPDVEDAARVLGASRWRAFREVTLPLLRPAVATSAAIVFLFTFTSFGVVLILGGARLATLEVEIWRQTTQLLHLDVAAALAVVQLAAVLAALGAYDRLAARAPAQRLRPAAEAARRPSSWGQRAFVGANLAVMAALLGTPVATLVERAFSVAGGYGLGWFRALDDNERGSALFVAPTEAVATSLRFAVAATAVALVVGGCAAASVTARRSRAGRVLDGLLMLPLGTSAVTVGFGFLIALDEPPLDLRASVWLVPLAHALVATPFVVRSVVPVLRAIDPALREAAAVLGAGPRRARWEVDLPIASRAGMVGAGLAFAVSLGEFGATVFVARPESTTMPVAIFRYLGQPGAANLGRAFAMSVLLMVVTGTAILVADRFRAGPVGEF